MENINPVNKIHQIKKIIIIKPFAFILYIYTVCSISTVAVQFSHLFVSDSLQPHGRQHDRLLCASPTPRARWNSCPLCRWRHPAISSSLIPFSCHLQSFPGSGAFPKSQFFASGDQRTGVSASASVLAMNIQDWFSLWLTGWSPCCPRDSQEFSPVPQFKSINSLVLNFL